MMRNGLVGLDVLNIAVHLTAAALAGAHPDVPFDGECLLTMPYGGESASIGSLELLAEHVAPDMIDQAAATTAGGRKPEDVQDLVSHVGHNKFDLVIMNPPFTRSVGQEGKKIGTGNPAFAGFETPASTQSAMQKKLNAVAGKGSRGAGNAGLGSHFGDLALRKLNEDGQIAFVLPLSAAVGEAWRKLRQALVQQCSEITVVSIAQAGSFERSFSADTGMAEILLLANRSADKTIRIRFASLSDSPGSSALGALIATLISQTSAARRIDAGPVGGTALSLGTVKVGELLECSPNDLTSWSLVGVSDMSLAQAALRLQQGHLALPGLPTEQWWDIPIATVSDIASIGPYHADIYWSDAKGEPRGPFELTPLSSEASTYPVLWAHDARHERQFVISPDSEAQIKSWPPDQPKIDKKAATIWATATRAHYNRDLQFNAQSLIVAMTERKCIGGRAWPSVILHNPDHEHAFSLWCNSTLGLLLHWWVSNKTQAGRGTTTVTSIPSIPTLDTRALSDVQHAEAKRQFDLLRNERFLPFDQIDEDQARAKLDRAILVDVLGLPESLVAEGGPIDLIRRKLAREPQIHGGKKSRVVFTGDGEKSVKRDDWG